MLDRSCVVMDGNAMHTGHWLIASLWHLESFDRLFEKASLLPGIFRRHEHVQSNQPSIYPEKESGDDLVRHVQF